MSKMQKLTDAFERLKSGNPIRISKSRKISPSAVEDEAGVGRSLLSKNKEYKYLLQQIVNAKRDQSQGAKSGNNKKLSSVDPRIKELTQDLEKSKSDKKALQKKYDKLLACNAELTQVILEKRFELHMDKISSGVVDNVLNYKEQQ